LFFVDDDDCVDYGCTILSVKASPFVFLYVYLMLFFIYEEDVPASLRLW